MHALITTQASKAFLSRLFSTSRAPITTTMVKSNQKNFVDYYVLLGFKPEDLDAILDPEEAERYVEKAYKGTARRIHPDKVKVAGLTEAEATAKKEEATANFQELQKAYEIMRNPWMRAEYDKIRNKNSTPESFKPDLVPTEGLRFSGYSDEGKGFFKVYGDVFEKIYANEVAFQEMKELPKDSVLKPPEIGDENSPYAAVVQFYNYWLNFTTIMDFMWKEPYDDLSEAPTKKGAQVMQRKNLKARKKGRNEYNKKVRRFAQYVRRRDIRVLEMMAKKEEERKREAEEEKERRRKMKKEKLEKAMEYEEPEWTKVVERKRRYGVEEEEEEEEREEWECVVCRKEFKSEKQCLNHEMSRKHREMVAMLMGLKDKNLVKDVLELMEEEDELDDDHVDEVEAEEEERESDSEEEVSECVDETLEQTHDNDEEEKEEEEEEEEEEKEGDEMDVLEAMMARRKSNVRGGEPIFEAMATVIDVEEDEVEHEETKKKDESGEKKPRRRRRRSVKSSKGSNEHDDMKESKPDPGAESCVDNGSEDEEKRKKGGKKEKRSKKNSKSNDESEDPASVKSSKSGSRRARYAGKMSRGHRPRDDN